MCVDAAGKSEDTACRADLRGQKGEEVEISNPKEKDLAAPQMRPKDSLIEVLILRRRLYVVQKMADRRRT